METPLDRIEPLTSPTLADRIERRLSPRAMMALLLLFWALIAFVAGGLLYFRVTDPAPAIPPARSADASAPTNTSESRAEAAPGKDIR